MKKLIYLIGFIICISACESKTEIEEIEVPAIRASKLFYADSVYSYMIKNGDNYQHLSHSYLNKAKQEKDPEKAIWFFKRAISLYPQVDSYRELGTLCLKNKKFEDAFSCFNLIVEQAYIKSDGDYKSMHIFGKPNSEDFENFIISCIYTNSFYEDLEGLIYRAIENGADREQLKSFIYEDSRINLISKPQLKKQLDLVFMDEVELGKYTEKLENFHTFISDFKTLDEPFIVNFEDIQKFAYTKYQIEEYDGVDLTNLESNFLPQKKNNPDSYLKYNKIGKFLLPDSNIIAIYKTDDSEYGIEKQKRNIAYFAAIYSPLGQLTDYKKIAWQESKTSATLNCSNYEFEISIFNRIWEKKEEVLSSDNELKNIVFSKKEAFKIEKGKFISKS
jgi:hypothetical protein